MNSQREKKRVPSGLVDRCLGAFVEAGTLDLSLDQLSGRTGTSKRMLVHYFGGREALELRTMYRLEERLQARFAPESLPAGWSPRKAVLDLWEQATSREHRGELLLIMEVARRAWSGSAAARAFYVTQQQLWTQLLLRFISDRTLVEELFFLFEGAALMFLVTGEAQAGRRALAGVLSRTTQTRKRRAR